VLAVQRVAQFSKATREVGDLMDPTVTPEQAAVCERFELETVPADPGMKVGVARNVKDGLLPLNGLRHRPTADTTGWYLWAGEEFSEDPDFFVPLHVRHLGGWCPGALPYLALPPGSRFLVAPDYEDVWNDESLLDH
jgi:hypothetical protein